MNADGGPARLTGMRSVRGVALRRRHVVVLVVAGVLVAALLAVGIPWTLSAVREDPAPPGGSTAPVRIAARLGSAVEVVAAGGPRRGDAAPDVRRVADAEQTFTLALLTRLSSTKDTTTDTAVSPASLAVALTMLQNGARGRTLDEIRTALSAGELSGADLDAGWAALTDAWSRAARADGVSLESADSVWAQRGLPLRAEFLGALRQWFDAGLWQVDFRHPGAVDAINRWTSERTHGHIPALFDRLPADTKAVLANAVHFQASWQQPFDPSGTRDGQFVTDRGPVTASFMSRLGRFATATTADWTAVQLPYRGSRFAALAIMPRDGSLADFVRTLDRARLATISAGLRPTTATLRLPRFTIRSTLDLRDTLAGLGMPSAFTDRADFSALSPRPLVVSRVVQRVYLSVGEKGTEADAATGISMVPTSLAPGGRIDLDHPFLFLVRDTHTGAILFAAQVQRPTA